MIAQNAPGVIHKRLIASAHHRVEDDVFHIQTTWKTTLLGFEW